MGEALSGKKEEEAVLFVMYCREVRGMGWWLSSLGEGDAGYLSIL